MVRVRRIVLPRLLLFVGVLKKDMVERLSAARRLRPGPRRMGVAAGDGGSSAAAIAAAAAASDVEDSNDTWGVPPATCLLVERVKRRCLAGVGGGLLGVGGAGIVARSWAQRLRRGSR